MSHVEFAALKLLEDIMEYVIDRFEGNFAVCESDSGDFIEIDKARLPEGVREGATIAVDNKGLISLADGSVREKRIADKMKAVWR
jgi:hypothetical protein